MEAVFFWRLTQRGPLVDPELEYGTFWLPRVVPGPPLGVVPGKGEFDPLGRWNLLILGVCPFWGFDHGWPTWVGRLSPFVPSGRLAFDLRFIRDLLWSRGRF